MIPSVSLPRQRTSGDVVRVPRREDAVGNALRSIFDAQTTQPADFAALLARLR